MMTRLLVSKFLSVALVAGATLACLGINARAAHSAEATAVDPMVEWFAAEEAGQIEIKFIPKDATEAMVLVKNLTAKPLNIKLPEAFAAVPINAQGMGGGGMGGGGMGGGGMGGGGGMFSLPPELLVSPAPKASGGISNQSLNGVKKKPTAK